MSKQEAERVSMYRCIIESIIKGEKVYVEWLTVMMQVCIITLNTLYF